MKKNCLKLISWLFIFGIVFSFGFVLAEPNGQVGEDIVIKNIANRILKIVMWFAYALALGSLIFFGIKYMLSGADEKANLKGMLPKYLIGMFAILFCFTIASWVAGIAGNDTADEIIKVGEEAGEQFTGATSGGDDADKNKVEDENSGSNYKGNRGSRSGKF